MKSKLLLIVPAALALSACRQDMHNQPKYKPYRESEFFTDKRSERQPVDDTVARGHLRTDLVRYTGKNADASDANAFPFPITADDMKRGQQRFNIYCSPCHSRLGDGNGQIVKRGFRQAASYHTNKLRAAPVGHFYDVITNGFGAMASYAGRVPSDDRWRIIAYIRALQASQTGTLNDVPSDKRAELDNPPPPPSGEPEPNIGMPKRPDMNGPQKGAPERGQPQKSSTQP